MKKSSSYLLSFFLILFGTACQQASTEKPDTEKEKPAVSNPLQFKIEEIQKKDGPCKEAGSACVEIKLKYPFAINGTVATRNAINNYVNNYIIKTLDFAPDKKAHNIESAIQRVFDNYKKEALEMGTPWAIEIENKIYQTEKIVTVELPTYTSLGGAHPNTFTAIGNFYLQTGKQIQFANFVTDKDALHTLASSYFLKRVGNIANEEATMDDFFNGEKFKLPENFGITEKGILFYYNPYEAAPYVFGGIEFEIPYTEIKNMIDKNKL